jgi:ubiquinone/menaquinone biosynthesis C-methylase UbiE
VTRPLATGRAASPRDHYSYTVYADPEMANRFDDLRFAGPIGELVAESQARVLLAFVGPPLGRTVIDVGTGTGRAAIALASQGASVTGIDASEAMLRVGRERAAARGVEVTFAAGDAHAVPYPDRSFDVAVSLRVLMHTPEWRVCLGELCRVARERVVIDFPARGSVAALQAAGRRLLARTGAGVEAYRVFGERRIAAEFARHGFRVEAIDRQFVLPIALHKKIGSRAVTERVERALRSIGLLRVFGSPVTMMARRCASS